MKVQIVTPYSISQLQRYGVTVRGNVTSVYPPLDRAATGNDFYILHFYNKTTFKLPLRTTHSIIYGIVPMWKFKCNCIVTVP
jgi:hypothetical protein